MKRIILAATLVGFVLSTATSAQAQGFGGYAYPAQSYSYQGYGYPVQPVGYQEEQYPVLKKILIGGGWSASASWPVVSRLHSRTTTTIKLRSSRSSCRAAITIAVTATTGTIIVDMAKSAAATMDGARPVLPSRLLVRPLQSAAALPIAVGSEAGKACSQAEPGNEIATTSRFQIRGEPDEFRLARRVRCAYHTSYSFIGGHIDGDDRAVR